MPLPKKHATLDNVKKIKRVKDDGNVLEQKDFIPMVLTTEMKLNKKKKNNMKMNDIFVTERNDKLSPITKPSPLKKNNMNAYQYTDKPIQMASINDFRN
tara:strand:+ start:1565 stop:1861 length:297 start_codon:yes stop_codon:yes gene_type:complete